MLEFEKKPDGRGEERTVISEQYRQGINPVGTNRLPVGGCKTGIVGQALKNVAGLLVPAVPK